MSRLTLIEKRPGGRALYQCECGNTRETRRNDVRIGRTKSCGCLHREASRARLLEINQRNVRHGHARRSGDSPEYMAWRAMIGRCTHTNWIQYKDWGGRGIRVCDEWRSSFEAFLAHVGPRPTPGHSIDRIDNDGHYEPGNVRWATRLEQRHNRRDSKAAQ